KRYEIHPDPDRLRRYGITLTQLQNGIASSNGNVGGDYLRQGATVQLVRNLGLIGQGLDPVQNALALAEPLAVNDHLRREERRRLKEIRQIVLTGTNNIPVCVEDVVEGGPLPPGEERGARGVVVGWQTRLGKVGVSRPRKDGQDRPVADADGQPVWVDED